jgi:hypothetical protein
LFCRVAIRATQEQLPEISELSFNRRYVQSLLRSLKRACPHAKSTLLENHAQLHNTSVNMLAAKWDECYGDLSVNIRGIKEDLKSSKMTQLRIEACMNGNIPSQERLALPPAEVESPIDQGPTLINTEADAQ